jgi:Bacterial antitoxin of type II TA system, VapB
MEVLMRTTLNLDNEAVDAAMAVSPGLTKTKVINIALLDYSRRKRLKGLLDLRGKAHWDGDLDALRKRA